VIVEEDDTLTFEGKTIGIAEKHQISEISNWIKATQPSYSEPVLFIRAHGNVRHQTLVNVIDAASRAGFKHFELRDLDGK
jgi:biopolymer transport protein ExbD